MRNRDITVKLHLSGLNSLMASETVQTVIDDKAKRISTLAGDGHEAVSKPHRWTARAYVQQKTRKQARRDSTGSQLLRAMAAAK